MDLIEKIEFTTKYLRGPRLRRGLKMLKTARKGYAFYGWELLKKTEPLDILKRAVSVNEIMLETLPDFLVGYGTLSFDNEKYQFKGKSQNFQIQSITIE